MLKNRFLRPKNDLFRQDMAMIGFLWQFLCKKNSKIIFTRDINIQYAPKWTKVCSNLVILGPKLT